MNWEMIGSIGELIGAFAVVVSLLYVGKQLKQTNSLARSGFRQELGSQALTWVMSIASSPSLAEAIAKVQFQGLERKDATDRERIHIAYAIAGLLGQIYYAYENWKEGILTYEEFTDLYSPSHALLSKPYLSSVWPIVRHGYPEDFNRWFEQRFGLAESGSTE